MHSTVSYAETAEPTAKTSRNVRLFKNPTLVASPCVPPSPLKIVKYIPTEARTRLSESSLLAGLYECTCPACLLTRITHVTTRTVAMTFFHAGPRDVRGSSSYLFIREKLKNKKSTGEH